MLEEVLVFTFDENYKWQGNNLRPVGLIPICACGQPLFVNDIMLLFHFNVQNECTCYADDYKKVWGKASDFDDVSWQTSKSTPANKLSCACSCGGIASFST
mmetsp:Transcript_55195/g.115457  ORF Transcript_55195/g.115457 Transcript_55195/m.115457 type:complete len:101 (+) Transcript_55195:502-804(+)